MQLISNRNLIDAVRDNSEETVFDRLANATQIIGLGADKKHLYHHKCLWPLVAGEAKL